MLSGTAYKGYSDNDIFLVDFDQDLNMPYTPKIFRFNASGGVKWRQGRLTTLVKITNLLNQEIQQHVFGDILKQSVTFEARFRF